MSAKGTVGVSGECLLSPVGAIQEEGELGTHFHSKSKPLLSFHHPINTEPQDALIPGTVQTDRLGSCLPVGGPRQGQIIHCKQIIRKSFSLAPLLALQCRRSSLPASSLLLSEGRKDSGEPQATFPLKLSLCPPYKTVGIEPFTTQ